MYPQGFHPIKSLCLPSGTGWAPYVSRRSVSVKYYFVDFGLSSHFTPDAQSRLVVGVAGRDQEVPELSEDVPYDPFKVDIFIIGNLLRNVFRAVCGLTRIGTNRLLTCLPRGIQTSTF